MSHLHLLRNLSRAAIALLFAVLPLLTALAAPSPAEAQVSALLPEALKNIEYPSEYAPTKRITLRNGRYEWDGPVPQRGNAVFVTSATVQQWAAVVIGTSTGGSGSFSTLHLVRAASGAAIAGPGLFLGDRIRIEKIGVTQEGALVIEMVTQGPNEPLCCGTKREMRDYLPDGNTFRLIAVDDVPVGANPTPPRTGNLGLAHDPSAAPLALLLAALALVVAARSMSRHPGI